ncbi:MAG: acetylxylan esterase [Phycisphaeraceae bacterium]|nr:acetylxylan esterase [Phycisphaeraceae bacterium]MCB9848845.1 acetylxylan esterase [Phycisphaeraceae bacterium]
MLSEPTDFAMSPISTLSYVADPTLSRRHSPFWARWDEVVESINPGLIEFQGDAAISGDPGVTHTIHSLGDVTIGARLNIPAGVVKPSAVVLQLHGYEPEPLSDDNPWESVSMATLQVRVRGFAGSWFETGDLKRSEHGWFCHGLLDLNSWILPGAVADVVLACRALEERFGRGVPIMLSGESFGGGLAVMAASRLAGTGLVDRMAIGLPSMGAWRWRLAQPPGARIDRGAVGINAEVFSFLNLHRDREEQIVENLSVCDSAIHARRVRIPSLFKLAERDDVVPAPAAAAVYNALGTDAGLKFREIVSHGHFDGGIADGRRHARWRSDAVEFLDPASAPALLIHRWSAERAEQERAAGGA